jgi:hypothetical protein
MEHTTIAALQEMPLQALTGLRIKAAVDEIVELCPDIGAGKLSYARGIAVAMLGPTLAIRCSATIL